jgi:hypothetical protein
MGEQVTFLYKNLEHTMQEKEKEHQKILFMMYLGSKYSRKAALCSFS